MHTDIIGSFQEHLRILYIHKPHGHAHPNQLRTTRVDLQPNLVCKLSLCHHLSRPSSWPHGLLFDCIVPGFEPQCQQSGQLATTAVTGSQLEELAPKPRWWLQHLLQGVQAAPPFSTTGPEVQPVELANEHATDFRFCVALVCLAESFRSMGIGSLSQLSEILHLWLASIGQEPGTPKSMELSQPSAVDEH